MKKFLIALPLIALIAAGCNSSQTSQNNSGSGTSQQNGSPTAGTPATPLTPTPGQNPAPTPVPPTQSSKNFSISASNYSFTPNMIKVSKGDKVNITFKVAEGFHNLTLTGYNLATKSIAAGQTDSLNFTANQTGTFQFYCSIDGHRELGMVGNLVVQ